MTSVLFVYITCSTKKEAIKIAKHLLKKRLCACSNVLGPAYAMYFWPPKSGKIVQEKEYILLCKTIQSSYSQLENDVKKIHSDKIPCITAFAVKYINSDYKKWLVEEIGSQSSST